MNQGHLWLPLLWVIPFPLGGLSSCWLGTCPVMASETRTTTDRDEIRRWVEQHDGTPAAVRRTRSKDSPGVLRFDFPGGAGEDELEHIDWDDWFNAFDDNNLALLYQEKKSSGEDSTFFKLVSRDKSQ
jgi:hypothetical protein